MGIAPNWCSHLLSSAVTGRWDNVTNWCHDDVIKWKLFPRYWPLCGQFTGHRWIYITKASDAGLWYVFDLCQNKHLTKQSWGWRFETPSRSLWRHCNALWVMNWKSVSITCINSQWPHMMTNIWVTLAQLMACCLGAPNHFMNHSSSWNGRSNRRFWVKHHCLRECLCIFGVPGETQENV